MNREILFRGKRIDNGEWVYGYFFTKVQFPKLATEREYYYIKPFGGDSNSWSHFEIDPATVGQYTNLIDKNGKKIFEGDILKWDADEYGSVYNEICSWDYELLNMRKNDWKDWGEVIGNIHDNLELLEGE